jgi:hypothetical protein
MTASVSANGGEALCERPSSQVTADHRRRSYAFSRRPQQSSLGAIFRLSSANSTPAVQHLMRQLSKMWIRIAFRQMGDRFSDRWLVEVAGGCR